MKTHTPGPWHWRAAHGHCFLESALPPEECHNRDVTVFALREDWASTFNDTQTPRYRRQFDRDLIAAAPDLLAALKIALHALEDVAESVSHDNGDREVIASAIRQARAATVKANGSR